MPERSLSPLIPVAQFDLTWGGQLDPQFEAAPNGAVEHFGVVGGADDDAVARHRIHVEEERGDDALYLSGFLGVGSFLADAVELVEEQDARGVRDVFDDVLQPRGGLAEIAADEPLVSNGQERKCELAGERCREACLAGAGRPDQQKFVSRLERMRAQQRRLPNLAD